MFFTTKNISKNVTKQQAKAHSNPKASQHNSKAWKK